MSSPVEQIKERLSIVDVVSTYIKLEKAGANFRARCPFHNERTPSFFVSPARESYHCFGCNRGGDIFTFVEEMEGVTFKEALTTLSDQAGVTLTHTPKSTDDTADQIIPLIEDATRLFQQWMVKEKGALSYMYDRGLKPETLKAFRIGFAPDTWDALSVALKEKGYADKQIVEAGLAVENDSGGIYDRFRNRIMFPINNTRGDVIAFSGRICQRKGAEDEKTAKYINTPETRLFHKGKVLYGYDSAKVAIRRAGTVIVVEGQMDLLMARQAGFEHTVAVSGTALTETHVSLLGRLAEKIILAYDSDEAGVSALTKTAQLTLRAGMDTRAIALSGAKDPADLIAEDKETWQALVEQAQPAVLVLTDILKDTQPDLHTLRRAVGKYVLPLCAAMENKIEQAHFLEEIARKLGLSEEPLREEMEKIVSEQPQDHNEPPADDPAPVLSIKNRTTRDLLGFYFWQRSLSEPGIELDSYEARITKALARPAEELWAELSAEQKAQAAFRAEHMYPDPDIWKSIAEELLTRAASEHIRERYEDAMRRLKEAEENGDEIQIKEILDECQKLSVQLHLLQHQQ